MIAISNYWRIGCQGFWIKYYPKRSEVWRFYSKPVGLDLYSRERGLKQAKIIFAIVFYFFIALPFYSFFFIYLYSLYRRFPHIFLHITGWTRRRRGINAAGEGGWIAGSERMNGANGAFLKWNGRLRSVAEGMDERRAMRGADADAWTNELEWSVEGRNTEWKWSSECIGKKHMPIINLFIPWLHLDWVVGQIVVILMG